MKIAYVRNEHELRLKRILPDKSFFLVVFCLLLGHLTTKTPIIIIK